MGKDWIDPKAPSPGRQSTAHAPRLRSRRQRAWDPEEWLSEITWSIDCWHCAPVSFWIRKNNFLFVFRFLFSCVPFKFYFCLFLSVIFLLFLIFVSSFFKSYFLFFFILFLSLLFLFFFQLFCLLVYFHIFFILFVSSIICFFLFCLHCCSFYLYIFFISFFLF